MQMAVVLHDAFGECCSTGQTLQHRREQRVVACETDLSARVFGSGLARPAQRVSARLDPIPTA